ncbi:MAG: trypsin-like peptidase domain-containing protein [Fimbriimonadaceae bacterium]|nr:trypsin-like peptidase domain-containing protein [Fimbriimonadaceae bacterium]
MKKFVLVLVAALVGGVLALQLDRFTRPGQPLVQVFDRTPAMTVGTQTPVDFTEAAKRILPSVVSIDTISTGMDWFGPVQQAGKGSGIICSPDGLIVTNAHVVGDDATGITVHLPDGRSLNATVKGKDPVSDLAVLKVDAHNLPPAGFGDSRALKVGQWVIAVGNPLGQDHTLSVGVVSSLGRDLSTNRGGVLLDAIQTDAAINPGNSGGALTDAQGLVIGINSAILSQDGGSIGIGFAIPIDRALRIISDLVEHGRARYGVLGFDIMRQPGALRYRPFRARFESQYGATPPETGEVVMSITPNSPAAKAGIRQFDVITKLNDIELKDRFDYVKFMAARRPGEKVRVTFWSQGKVQSKELELVDINEI